MKRLITLAAVVPLAVAACGSGKDTLLISAQDKLKAEQTSNTSLSSQASSLKQQLEHGAVEGLDLEAERGE